MGTSMRISKRIVYVLFAGVFAVSNLLFGFPADYLIQRWNESQIVDSLYLSKGGSTQAPTVSPLTQTAKAANFTMQTGYYVGNGGTQSISGLGFQPEYIMIKADTAAGQVLWKTSAMPANTTAFLSATAVNTGTLITFDSDGFSVANNANVNTANVRYTWSAFQGSDCTASGTICVGTYTGNGTSPRLINTGFQPNYVMTKISTNTTAANFRTSSMGANVGNYFTTTAQNATGALYTTLAANGFNVGATNNTSAQTFYYVAFKAVAGVMAVGTYSGNATDNRSITGFGAGSTPNLVMVKNANSAQAASRNPIMSTTRHYGDHSSYMSTATANAVNMIQAMQDNGFQVGTANQVNKSGNTIYWVAWGGAASQPPGSGTFQMATGTYTGNGAARTISGVGFDPDLVIIKGDTAQQGVFRTKLMQGNNTAYMAAATANFTGGITSLGTDSFDLGTSATVNSTSINYHWQAFGNAYDPVTRTGATDFMIGAYTGNGIDNRSITDAPDQPDMVTVKRSGATAGSWRSTANTGDQSSFFANTAERANRIQALEPAGFQVGTLGEVNTSGSLYNWFGFGTGENFAVGTYTGSGGVQSVTSAGFQPDHVWVKRSTNQQGVQRPSTLLGNSTQYFANTTNFTNGITGLVCNGFSLTGTTAMTNASGGTYRYAAWRIPSSILAMDIVDANGCPVSSPTVAMSAAALGFSCQTTTGTLGIASERLRATNTTTNPNWSLTIAATGGATSLWTSGGQDYDYNDPAGSPVGCSDGGDSDTRPGQLTIDPSVASITPKSGCTSTGVNLSSSSAFSQSVLDSLTLATASGAGTGCYWDLTGISLTQRVPAEQPLGAYTLNLTVTIVAN